MKWIRGFAVRHAPHRAGTCAEPDRELPGDCTPDARADRLLASLRPTLDGAGRFQATLLDVTDLPADLLPDLFVVRVDELGGTPVLAGANAGDPWTRLADLPSCAASAAARCADSGMPVRLPGPDGTPGAGVLLPLSADGRISHVLGLLPSGAGEGGASAPHGGCTTANLPRSDVPAHAEMLAYWASKSVGRLPARSDIDPVSIPHLLRYLMLVDVLGPPLDFRYRLLGDEILQRARPGLKGQRYSQIPGKGPGSSVWASASKVVETRLPRYGRAGYVGPDRFTAAVDDLLMPLSDDGVNVSQILIVAVFRPRPLDARWERLA